MFYKFYKYVNAKKLQNVKNENYSVPHLKERLKTPLDITV